MDQTAQREAKSCSGKAILLKIIAGIGIASSSRNNGTTTKRKTLKPAKKRIVRRVQRRHFATGPRQQVVETSGAHSEQRIVREAEAGPGNQLEIHQTFDRCVMGRADVFDADSLVFERILQREAANRSLIEPGLHALTNNRLCRAAIMSFQFEPVEHGRIVAGRDHHPANSALRLDRE